MSDNVFQVGAAYWMPSENAWVEVLYSGVSPITGERAYKVRRVDTGVEFSVYPDELMGVKPVQETYSFQPGIDFHIEGPHSREDVAAFIYAVADYARGAAEAQGWSITHVTEVGDPS